MGLVDTKDMERSLLKVLCRQQLVARKYWNRASRDWMTSPERRFLFDLGLSKHRDSKTLLTDLIVERQVEIDVEAKERTHYLAEWKLVKGVVVNESPDWFIDELTRVHLALDAIDITGDVEDMIQAGRIDEAVDAARRRFLQLKSGRVAARTVEFTDNAERQKGIEDKKAHPEKYLGLKTGFPKWDMITGGLHPGEMTLLSAVTGVGKSTTLKAFARGVLFNNPGKNVLYITNEETEEQVLRKFDALFTEIPQSLFKRPDRGFEDEQMRFWNERLRLLGQSPFGKLFIREVPAYSTVVEVEQSYHELVDQGVSIDLIVYDYLGRLKPVQQAWGENDEDGKRTAECQDLARAFNTHVVSAAQAATVVAEKQEKGRSAGDLDVYGGKGQIHHVQTFAIITRVGRAERQPEREEWERDWFLKFDLKKARDNARFDFRVVHKVLTGRMIQVDEDGNEEETAPVEQMAKRAAKRGKVSGGKRAVKRRAMGKKKGGGGSV